MSHAKNTHTLDALDVLKHDNWARIWTLMNYFASGESQNQHARVEPIAVLGEVYFMLAQIDQQRQQVLEQCQQTQTS